MITTNKRYISILLVLILMVAVLPIRVEAAQAVKTEIEYLPDGGYIESVLLESTTRAAGTRVGSKLKRYVDSDGNEQWVIRLQGTFSYNGSSATCTDSECNVTISAVNWSVATKSTSKDGAVATADVTMVRKVLGITVSKSSYQLTLTCDKNGNLS